MFGLQTHTYSLPPPALKERCARPSTLLEEEAGERKRERNINLQIPVKRTLHVTLRIQELSIEA